MAIVAPFSGLRYNTAKISRLEDVVTPPYDVIDLQARRMLLEKNPYSMIKLDLSKDIEPGGMTDARYNDSRKLLEEWLRQGILVRDEEPAIYLYYIDYNHPSGRRLTRKGLICLTELAEFSEGIVKPHEKFFRNVVSDRLRLLDACRTQFSQVFSVYPDRENQIINVLEDGREPEPLCACDDQDGCRHVLWPVTDRQAIARVREQFADKCLYIADGHHRYNTALQMRELMAGRQGGVSGDSPFNFIMMYLSAMEDPGLSVLPTHRLVRLAGTAADELVAELAPGFAIEEIEGGSRETLISEVLARMEEKRGRGNVFGLYHPGEDRCFLLVGKEKIMEKAGFGAMPAPLRELDVVVLSELILGKYLGLDHDRCEEENLIDYFSDPDDALDRAVKESGESEGVSVIFLMNNTEVDQVKKVSDAELVMPHKSTYFYPKILTGLVMNRLVEGEKVDL
ncbi:MAG: DUF1015 domain-containing protein [Desulfurivibrionaceae bacterium]|nr:DUF1015 domain-containing protein [Desulfurivibrionaceae bacterium]